MNLHAQYETDEDLIFKAELEKFVKDKITEIGKEAIPKEKFLIQQMRMLNEEIRQRVSYTGDVRDRYFDNLQLKLDEINNLKTRLNRVGGGGLIAFINELEKRIEETIETGKIDFKRQKVFEDGIQLLYLAEEMVNLDPNARVEDNPEISKELKSSKQKFINEFGESSSKIFSSSRKSGSEDASIFDLFKQWKLTNTYKYEVRWTDVQIVKNKLLRNSTGEQRDRMLKRELTNAATQFNFGYYKQSDKCFEEIINRFDQINNKDDIYYYWAESKFNLGQYNAAYDLYLKLVDEYPTSSLSAATYAKLIFIAYHFEKFSELNRFYSEYEKFASFSDPEYAAVQLIAANSAYNANNYETAVNIAVKIGPNSSNYYDAQFLLAKAYSGAENLEQAESVYNGLLLKKGLKPEQRFDVLLRLAYINFEKELYPQVLTLLDQININYSFYDQVLMTFSWTLYKMELANPTILNRDFTLVVEYLKKMINDYPESDYYLEAKTLLGYVYQLEEKVNSALNEYDYVYKSRFTKERSDEMIVERDSLKQMLRTTERLVEKALATRKKEAFKKAKKVNSHLNDLYMKVSYNDISSSGMAARNEVKRVAAQIHELDRIKKSAEEKGDLAVLQRAKLLRSRLMRVLTTFPVANTISPLGLNYFDEHPLARKESVIEDQNSKVLAMRSRSERERSTTIDKIADIDRDINQAKANKDYSDLIHLEIQRDKFKSFEQKLDYLESYSYSLGLQDSYVDLQRWSDFGGFGIANVNFELKNLKSKKMSAYNDQIVKINNILNTRKQLIEHKIQLIEGEINLMTRKVRQQERLREREELNRKFEESYFDTHTTEADDTNVVPPEFNEE
jgi:TolA-binding protein